MNLEKKKDELIEDIHEQGSKISEWMEKNGKTLGIGVFIAFLAVIFGIFLCQF